MPIYIPKKGVLATFQVFKYGLFRKSGENRRDWARRIHQTAKDRLSLADWGGQPWDQREFLLYVWKCLFTLAKEEKLQARVDEYSKARNLITKAFRNVVLTRPLVLAGYVFSDDEIVENSSVGKNLYKWVMVLSKLSEVGLDILENYANEGRLPSWQDVDVFDKETFNQYVSKL